MKTFTFEVRCPECDEVIDTEAEFEPEVPPKPCMNPDDPAYSDPGSAGGAYAGNLTCKCGRTVTERELYAMGESAFREEMEAAAEDAALRKYEDWRDR